MGWNVLGAFATGFSIDQLRVDLSHYQGRIWQCFQDSSIDAFEILMAVNSMAIVPNLWQALRVMTYWVDRPRFQLLALVANLAYNSGL